MVLSGDRRFQKIVARNFIIKIVGVALIFLFVKSSGDLLLYVICHSATLFLGNLSMCAYIPKLVGKVKVRELEIKKHFASICLTHVLSRLFSAFL